MRTVINLAREWHFEKQDGTSEQVTLPHTNRELPLNGFDESESFFVSTYTRQVAIPEGKAGTRYFLDFDGVMCACEVSVNGCKAGSHKGGFTPFSFEITGLVDSGSIAELSVRVDSTERSDIPPFGHVVDYLCFGGIYRDVRLRIQDAVFISAVFVRPQNVLEKSKKAGIEITLDGQILKSMYLECALREGERMIASTNIRIPPETEKKRKFSATLENLEGIRVWDIDDPALYTVTLRIFESGTDTAAAATEVIDETSVRTAFRKTQFTRDGFFLNGRILKLVGLNRHQAWPYAGFAMPERAQRRDAEILKNELGLNIVRTSHYPQSPYFLDACDELGLLVLTEIPGWQHIGNTEWQDNACADLEAMIIRDRNHPSVVLWGVRINESKDDHDFYARTNEIARRLDPERQTGGIRCIGKSELLEDVYTFNDFSHSGNTAKRALQKPSRVTGRQSTPYLVTEHNGHMFPTKRFDNEERLTEHALRHARVLDAALGTKGLSGAIGWCAFDYNTHKDFGSGDRICYHGVCDIFRYPKYAAYVYASQMSPDKKIVLEAASLFAKGERSAAHLLPIEVWTNCDSVILSRGGKRIGEYFPDRKDFPNLMHPPVVIRNLIGEQLEEKGFSRKDGAEIGRIIGKIFTSGMESLSVFDYFRMLSVMIRTRTSFSAIAEIADTYMTAWGKKDESFGIEGILNGKSVVRKTWGADAHAVSLELSAETRLLKAGDGPWDTTRILVKAIDQYGNLHPFTAEAVHVELLGPATLIGPASLPLTAGCAAFWIKTKGDKGTVTVRINGGRFAEQKELTVEVI